ncbi:hypothetical protein PIB30_078158, partial [Stylosanthes scabra]|nr:hypothetical protein [Stylosanthes scabra]
QLQPNPNTPTLTQKTHPGMGKKDQNEEEEGWKRGMTTAPAEGRAVAAVAVGIRGKKRFVRERYRRGRRGLRGILRRHLPSPRPAVELSTSSLSKPKHHDCSSFIVVRRLRRRSRRRRRD